MTDGRKKNNEIVTRKGEIDMDLTVQTLSEVSKRLAEVTSRIILETGYTRSRATIYAWDEIGPQLTPPRTGDQASREWGKLSASLSLVGRNRSEPEVVMAKNGNGNHGNRKPAQQASLISDKDDCDLFGYIEPKGIYARAAAYASTALKKCAVGDIVLLISTSAEEDTAIMTALSRTAKLLGWTGDKPYKSELRTARRAFLNGSPCFVRTVERLK